MEKTVFISSTYEDLAEHRRAVWQVLEGFEVAVRGMEQFGARTEAPLQTCLAEVEQSDVYVGIIAFRFGSMERRSGKSFTQIEYEHAHQLGKEVLIYLADERVGCVRYVDIDLDHLQRERLIAFKSILKERHTTNTFSTPEDLAEKLKTDFAKHFQSTQPVANRGDTQESEFESTLALVRRFRLLPKTLVGREVRLAIRRIGNVFPASRALCRAFNLEYGRTIGVYIQILKPNHKDMKDFKEIYASGTRVYEFLSLMDTKQHVEVYARLEFTPDDVRDVRGEFFGYEYEPGPDIEDGPYVYVAPEGKVILLFSKTAV
jgi:hypothetical protein